MINQNRRTIINLLPYTLVGGFTYPIGKFLFFSENTNIKSSISLKNIKKELTYVKQANVFIYKKDTNIKIFDAHCTHMGCILNFNPQKKQFNCPCHKSRFDINGIKLKGPAKRDLDRISFYINNKTIYFT